MGSTLITLAEVRENVPADLSDAALERLIDTADADIVQYSGTHDGARSRYYNLGLPAMGLIMPVGGTVTAVRHSTDRGKTWTDLQASDYLLNGVHLNRTTGYWDGQLLVRYTEPPRTAERIGALISLVRLYARESGVASENIGGYTYTNYNLAKERNNILRRLSPLYLGHV